MSPEQAAATAAIAAVVSAVAALVSLGALMLTTWLQWRAGRPRVEVEGAIHTLVSSTSMGDPKFGIEVRNVGVIPVVVTSVGVRFRDGELGTLPYARTLMGEQVLPKKLESGESVSLANELQPVVDSYFEKGIVSVWARTQAGRVYDGKNTAKLDGFKPSTDKAATPRTGAGRG